MINRVDPATQPAVPARAPGAPTTPVGAAPPARIGTRDQADAGFDALIVRMGPPYGRLLTAARSGDAAAARQALNELQPLLDAGRGLAAGSRHAEAFAKVEAAAAAVRAQLPAADAAEAPATQRVLVGVPGRGGRVVEVPREAEKPAHGPFAFLSGLASGLGKGLKAVGHVVFFPLELAGKVLDPVREGVGKVLGGAKAAIDSSLGRIPVLGQAVRFTTGFAASLVGLVDGALQGVTHPVELVEGLGRIAWTALGLVPGVRTVWDVAVEGKSPAESLGGAWREAGAIGKAFFQGSIDDFKAGNWSGALGRLTGDVGSFFVTGGGAAAARTAEVGVVAARTSRLAKLAEVASASRVGRLARAARLDRAVAAGARAGIKAIEVANVAGAKIMVGGVTHNMRLWQGAGRAFRRVLPQGEKVAAITGGRLATPAATMDRPKVASAIRPDLVAGEIKPSATLTREEALARQPEVLRDLNGPAIHEAIPDRVIGGMVDSNADFVKAVKGLKLDGKPVTTLQDAAEAWKLLPADSPLRASVGKNLAAMIQEGFRDGLGFPPAAMEFKPLAENLAGMESRGKVFLDPAILNEDLDFVVHVMAEEQTHAYQRFLVENREALAAMPDRVRAQVDKFAKDFATETYVYPPTKALATFNETLATFGRNAADHADELDYARLRKTMVAQMPAGTPERIMLDAWWARTDEASKRLSFLKYVEGEFTKAKIDDRGIGAWRADMRYRNLPEGILERNGLPLSASETHMAMKQAIAETQAQLKAANAEAGQLFTAWDAAYRGQSLEFVAKGTADSVAQWILAQGD